MRGFSVQEYQNRLSGAQSLMAQENLDGLLLTTEAEICYFTGFLTRFWESPTRPWYLIVPQSGLPIAVIPSIGAELMSKTWIDDIRTWASPNLFDDGITLLADTLHEVLGQKAQVGVPSGHETYVRMPLDDLTRLKSQIAPSRIVGDQGIIRALRMVKSDAEIQKISTACAIAGRAFERVGEFARKGIPLSQVFRSFQQCCLEEGADWVPYVAGGTGPLGYGDVISPANDEPLIDGHVLMLDTGVVYDGYFCDFDRNYSVGVAHKDVEVAWKRLLDATEAGREAARPGNTAIDIYIAMDKVLTGGVGGGSSGRLGHGLGMELTEWPSFMPDDSTEMTENMVITLEPCFTMADGSLLVHEDNFVITSGELVQLSPKAPDTLWSL